MTNTGTSQTTQTPPDVGPAPPKVVDPPAPNPTPDAVPSDDKSGDGSNLNNLN